MTLQQEAIQLINRMPDESVRVIIDLLHIMNPEATDEEEIDRMDALRWMQSMHENMPDNLYADMDIDQERQEALEKKYGSFN